MADVGAEAAERTTTELRAQTPPETDPSQKISGSIARPAVTGSRKLRVYPNGVVGIGRTLHSVTKRMGGRVVIAAWDLDGVVFANTEGEILAEYFWPPEGTTYVGMSRARTHFRR